MSNPTIAMPKTHEFLISKGFKYNNATINLHGLPLYLYSGSYCITLSLRFSSLWIRNRSLEPLETRYRFYCDTLHGTYHGTDHDMFYLSKLEEAFTTLDLNHWENIQIIK